MRGLGSGAVFAALVALSSVSAGCNETPASIIAGVDGPHDLAIVDGLLFVTATDENELRVVDLDLERPDWIRGPNPLHPLSIPVTTRPVELAQDVRWTEGAALGGQFVYARSATGQEISVVPTDRQQGLRELPERVRLEDGEGSITAIAGRSDGAGNSTLFFAVFQGNDSAVYSKQVGSAEAPALRHTVTCGAITSLLVLPDENELGISIRRPSGAFERCTTTGTLEERLAALDELNAQTAFVVNLSTGATTPLDFGAPIRRLFTHGAYASLPAAQRIFGLIDADACAQAGCRGVLAVDWAEERSGILVHHFGLPMQPLDTGGPLPMGLALGENTFINLQPHTSLLGVIPAADGRLYFFDAGNARPLDVDPAGPSPVLTGDGADAVLALTRTHPDRGGDVIVEALQEGATRTEEIALTYLGALPGFARLDGPDVAATTVDVPEDPTFVVEPGDVVDASAECAAPAGVTVTAAARRSVLGGTLELSAPIGGPGCVFTVRPPPSPAPWTVVGTSSGYLGRVSSGAGIELPAPERRLSFYFYIPADPPDPLPPLIRFGFAPPDVTGVTAADGLSLRFATRSGFRPASAGLEARQALNLRLEVAGAAQFRPGMSNRLAVSYPSGDVVLQVYPQEITPDAPITRFDTFR